MDFLSKFFHFDNNFALFFFERTPFNWQTPLRYLIVLLYQWAISFMVLLSVDMAVFFLVASCIVLKSFIEDTTNDLKLFIPNEKTSNKKGETKRNAENKMKMKMKFTFCNIIKSHSDIKQLSLNLSN